MGIQTVNDAKLLDLIFCDERVGLWFDWEHVFGSLSVERAQSDNGIDEGFICNVKGGGDTLRREQQPILEDTRPFSRQVSDEIGPVEVLRVQYQEDEVGCEEATEQSEEVHSELISHRTKIPTNLLSEVPLALSKAVDIIASRG